VEFKDKVVAITGASGGIGRELCRFFGKEGAKIVAMDISPSVTAFADELRSGGISAESAIFDVGDNEAVKAAFAGLPNAFAAVDILINNAGVSKNPALGRTTPEGWRDDVNANLNGAYYCTYAVLAGMKERGKGVIINIGSVNGFSALGDAAYSAGKAGMVSLTRSMAQEFGRFNIRVNVVCPGTVRTPIWDERSKRNPEVLKQLTRWYPLGRIVEPIEVMRAVAFLASDAASAITGVSLPVDCGLMAGNIVMARELTLEDF
jgi:NAD(P)-dependent dehydrogenase (short-subunit alcohol dehydrogenase family)